MDRKIRTYSNLAQPVSHQGGDIEKLISRPGVIHVNPRSVETVSYTHLTLPTILSV